ncbi:MAG: AarF/UbiB family protein, partial [Desulfobacterales bacterium]
AAHLSRLRTIASVLLKYGFDDLISHLELPGKAAVQSLSDLDPGLGTHQRIRLALQELGPTFVKFGQILSVRSEALPRPLIDELAKLQDEVNPIDTAMVREVVEAELGRPIEEVFIGFVDRPLAAASLSQVHRAALKITLEPVALKVQRPDIRKQIAVDLELLALLASQLHQRVERFQVHNLPSLVDVIGRTLERELDFKREANHMIIARRHMQELDGIVIPRVHDDVSTERLLVMEYIEGKRLREMPPDSLEAAEALARLGLRASVKQILEKGFFHADPHPGNLLVSEGRRLCILDWGMVGRLTSQERYELIDLIGAVVSNDSEELTEAVLSIAARGEGAIDRRALERNLMEVLDSHLTDSVATLRVGRIILDVMDMVRSYRLKIPSNLVLMLKSLVTAEGTARIIYPELNVVGELEPDVRRLARERFNPSHFWRLLKLLSFRVAVSPMRFPKQIGEIVEKMGRGEFKVRFEHHNLRDLRMTLEKIFSRLTIGIIAAAMIIASSMIMTTGLPPLFFGYPLLGLVGYTLSALSGMWLIVDIIGNR